MDKQDFLKLESAKVRRSPDLFAFFQNLYQETFNAVPDCSSCSFNKDFRRLQEHLFSEIKNNNVSLQTNKKYKIMSAYQLKNSKNEILFYDYEGKRFRCYDNMLNDSFVEGFLTHGTTEEIEVRKKLFNVIPENLEVVDHEELKEDKEISTNEEEIKPKEQPAKKEVKKKQTEKKEVSK